MALPLRVTVATTFALLVIVSISVVAGVNFAGGREAARQTADMMIHSSVGSAQNGIERLVVRSMIAAESIVSLPIDMFDWRAPEPLLGTLTITLRNLPEAYGVFAGFPDGAFVQALRVRQADEIGDGVVSPPPDASFAWRVIGPVSGEGDRPEEWRYFDADGAEILVDHAAPLRRTAYDPRIRPWFGSALDRENAVVTAPYVFQSLQQPGVTISQSATVARGTVIGIDLALGDLSEMAQRLQPGAHGLLAVLDDSGRLIARSEGGGRGGDPAIGNGSDVVGVSARDDPLLHTAILRTQGVGQTFVSFNYDGQTYVAARKSVTVVGASQWTIVTVASMKDYAGILNTALNNSLILSALVLVVLVIAVAAMAGWITQPVLNLRQMADRIARLDLSDARQFDTPFIEIQELQSSMERMRNALGTSLQFIPRDVVSAQIEHGEIAGVGGERREVTLLFSDIEDFTSISEKMTPEQIMSQVSRYFEQLSIAIQSNAGTIDKFIGDAVMAMWNAPNDDVDHVAHALQAVLSARQRVENLNRDFAAEGLPVLKTRFGLHFCDALVGNVGAPDRMQYTCLGSGVNLASRIEGLNKFYGTGILVSDAVRRQAGETYLFRRVDLVRAKGLSRPVTIFELLGERDQAGAFFVGPETVKMATQYEQAFDFYLHRDFGDAVAILQGLSQTTPKDYVVETMLEKCRGFLGTPPPADWDGSTALDYK